MDVDEDKSQDSLCQICYIKKPFYTCPDCNIKACRSCLKKYILEYSNLEPHCVKCMVKLSFNTIYQIFGAKDFDKYLSKAADIKFNLEVQKIPECLECCSIIKSIKHIQNTIPYNIIVLLNILFNTENNSENNSYTNEFYNLITSIIVYILKYCNDKNNSEITKKEMSKLNKIIIALKDCSFTQEQYTTLQYKINEHITSTYNINLNDLLKVREYILMQEKDIIKLFANIESNKCLGKSSKIGYLFRCTYDTCNGFVNENYVCELCKRKYCNKCFVLLDNVEKHVCKKEDILTANEILNSTKPCPKCASRIFKISGCSQMFCTNCHTGFDYNTGKIITTDFHNPHRMEWLLSNGKNINIEHDTCNNIDFIYNKHLMFRLYQTNHVKEMLRKIDRKMANNDVNIFHMRCKYVLNTISKESFIQFLKRNELDKYKSLMLTQIYQEFIDVSNLILNTAQQKDIAIIDMLLSKNVSKNLYSFVVTNGLVNVIKKLVKNNMNKNEYKLTIDKIISYKKENNETIYIPNSCNVSSLISLIYENKYLVTQFDSFDEEINLLNELVEHTNLMLINYKEMFKIRRISQLSPLGSEEYVTLQ